MTPLFRRLAAQIRDDWHALNNMPDKAYDEILKTQRANEWKTIQRTYTAGAAGWIPPFLIAPLVPNLTHVGAAPYYVSIFAGTMLILRALAAYSRLRRDHFPTPTA